MATALVMEEMILYWQVSCSIRVAVEAYMSTYRTLVASLSAQTWTLVATPNLASLVSRRLSGLCKSQFSILNPLSDNDLDELFFRLDNTKRQDITLISFQIWVFGMSIVALLNESIPHICVALLMHLVVTIWTVFQVFQTVQFRHQFAKIITNGACEPKNLLGSYWGSRQSAEITSAVLNAVSSLIVVMLTYRLMKVRLLTGI